MWNLLFKEVNKNLKQIRLKEIKNNAYMCEIYELRDKDKVIYNAIESYLSNPNLTWDMVTMVIIKVLRTEKEFYKKNECCILSKNTEKVLEENLYGTNDNRERESDSNK